MNESSTTIEILLVTNDPETAHALQPLLGCKYAVRPDGMCLDLSQLPRQLACSPAAGVIVDIDPHPEQTLRLLEPIIARFPQSRFILLCQSVRSELVLEAMQIGARHLLNKQQLSKDLEAVMERVLKNPAASSGCGKVITVFSAGGGCGSTTVAINVANEIQANDCTSTLLVDLDWPYGGLGTYLGVRGVFGIADVLAHPRTPDSSLISTGAIKHTSKLSVLLSPGSVRFGSASPACENLPTALQACRSAYSCTLIDAPHLPLEVAEILAGCSDMSLIVMQPAVKDVSIARNLYNALKSRGGSSAQIGIIINRYHRRRASISLQECERALGLQPFAVLRNDSKSGMLAATLGQTLSQVAPRSTLRQDIRELARRVWSDQKTETP